MVPEGHPAGQQLSGDYKPKPVSEPLNYTASHEGALNARPEVLYYPGSNGKPWQAFDLTYILGHAQLPQLSYSTV